MPFDPAKAKRAWVMPWQNGWTTSVVWLDKSRVAAGNNYGQILIFQVPDELPPADAIEKGNKDEFAALPLKPERLLLGHTNEIGDLAATADGKRLFSCSYDHSLRVWDLSAPTERTETVPLYDERGQQRAKKAGRTDEEIKPVDVPVQTVSQELAGHNPEWIRALDMNADKTKLLSGDDSGLAILWDVATLKEVARVKNDVGWIRGLALSPDAKQAVTTNYAIRYSYFPSHIRLWDLETGQESLELEKSTGANNRVTPINAADFSPDGKLVALGKGGEDGGGAIFIVQLEGNKKLHQLKGHEYGATCVRFTSDGQHLVTCGRDTLVAIWQVSDGKQVKTLGTGRGGQFKDWIHDVDFNPDETRLAAADMAGMVHIWDFT
ncbi:MAG: hypothetical protein WED34_12845 [Planctomycetales bacterium]